MHTVSAGVRTDLGGDYGDDGYGANDIVGGTGEAEGDDDGGDGGSDFDGDRDGSEVARGDDGVSVKC